MARTVAIGIQDFASIITNAYFYIDKTSFIREWWENGDSVTLITRPRRFGKTLNMRMVEQFFSTEYAGRSDLFAHLDIWRDAEYHDLQGTYPVIFISFADIKETSFSSARKAVCRNIKKLYNKYDFLLDGDYLNEDEKDMFREISPEMEDYIAADSIRALSDYLGRYYGRKPLILLDEYDTPMQEAYVNGYWPEIADFFRSLFNAAFKTNPYFDKALLTGITRVSKESVFSDLNNLEVVTTTSDKYTDCFGFTQEEVSEALTEFGLSDQEQNVRDWYDGFTFGRRRDIYNPWSIINFLDKQVLTTYWANTSSNSLIGKLIREGSADMKVTMEILLSGGTFHTRIDEQIIFSQLDHSENAVWSLLLATGYLRVEQCILDKKRRPEYELALTNQEIMILFETMIDEWFRESTPAYNTFIKALLCGDVEAMNIYMNRITGTTFSYFDTGRHSSAGTEPERFYHGFVLGLMVDLEGRYRITSNRESGFGRYDVVLQPLQASDDAIIIEFKVCRTARKQTLEEAVAEALEQIDKMQYAAALEAEGIPAERIRKYGFAFEGKKVLIGRS